MTIVQEEDIGYDLVYLFGEDDQEELGYDLGCLFGEDDQEAMKDPKTIPPTKNFKVKEATWNWEVQEERIYDFFPIF